MTVYEFLGPEWLAEVERLVHSRITPEVIHHVSTDILAIFENCPDGSEKALYMQTQKGDLSRIAEVYQPYPDCEFIVSGAYQKYMEIFKGKLDPMTALMSGDLHFQGNMLRAMGMISVIEPFFKVLAEIPTDFDT